MGGRGCNILDVDLVICTLIIELNQSYQIPLN
jgi:hypothetical protein